MIVRMMPIRDDYPDFCQPAKEAEKRAATGDGGGERADGRAEG